MGRLNLIKKIFVVVSMHEPKALSSELNTPAVSGVYTAESLPSSSPYIYAGQLHRAYTTRCVVVHQRELTLSQIPTAVESWSSVVAQRSRGLDRAFYT